MARLGVRTVDEIGWTETGFSKSQGDATSDRRPMLDSRFWGNYEGNEDAGYMNSKEEVRIDD